MGKIAKAKADNSVRTPSKPKQSKTVKVSQPSSSDTEMPKAAKKTGKVRGEKKKKGKPSIQQRLPVHCLTALQIPRRQSAVSLPTCSSPMTTVTRSERSTTTTSLLVCTYTSTLGQKLTPHAGQVGKVLGEKWKNLSDKDKQKYKDLAETDKKRYEDEKAAYMVSSPSP